MKRLLNIIGFIICIIIPIIIAVVGSLLFSFFIWDIQPYNTVIDFIGDGGNLVARIFMFLWFLFIMFVGWISGEFS